MSEMSFKSLSGNTKEESYESFIALFRNFLSAEDEMVSTLANSAAALKEAFGFFWVGFYLVKGEELILGPFQGSAACTRIRKGRGVCGTAWSEGRSIVVPDVEQFPGHIACSSLSRSEIVIPLKHKSEVTAVLDIDSDSLSAFDDTDRLYLEQICGIIKTALNPCTQ